MTHTVKHRRNSKANLRPWKTGQSGNPAGRPRNADCLTTLMRAEIEKIDPDDPEGRTWQEQIVLATIRLAIKGNSTALKEVWDRLDGKVAQAITGTGGEPLPGVITVQFVNSGDCA